MEAIFISLAEQLSHLEYFTQEAIHTAEEVLAENHVDRVKHVSILKDLLVTQAVLAKARKKLEDGRHDA